MKGENAAEWVGQARVWGSGEGLLSLITVRDHREHDLVCEGIWSGM